MVGHLDANIICVFMCITMITIQYNTIQYNIFITRDIHFRNGHMQNSNFLQFRYFVIYFVIFVSMDWETESVMIVIM
jgi:hypothetical protein